MIIAAFSGTGKSYFAEHVAEAKDFSAISYQYKDVNKNDIAAEEVIKKSDSLRERNRKWPDNYIGAVANLYHDYRYFIIPSDRAVLRGLQLLQIPYILVYPERKAKEEYKNRFAKRENADHYLHDFIDGWDLWMDQLRRDSYGWCMELPAGEYLTDIKADIDQVIDREEVCVPIDIDHELLKAVSKKLEELGLCPAEYLRRCLVWTVHHEAEAKKVFHERKCDDN